MTYVLLINYADYETADVHGPFESVKKAQQYAERYRAMQGLPVEATPDNNDRWTDEGWYFGIVKPRLDLNIAASAARL